VAAPDEGGGDVVADLDVDDVVADALDDAGAFVAEDRGPFEHRVVEGRDVGVAQPGRADPHHDFVWSRVVQVQVLDRERGLRSSGYGGSDGCGHGPPPVLGSSSVSWTLLSHSRFHCCGSLTCSPRTLVSLPLENMRPLTPLTDASLARRIEVLAAFSGDPEIRRIAVRESHDWSAMIDVRATPG